MTPSSNALPAELPVEAIAHLHQGRLIEAVKVVRRTQGLQLKEAKDAVDAYLRDRPTLQAELAARQSEAGRALLRWVVVIGCLVAAACFLVNKS